MKLGETTRDDPTPEDIEAAEIRLRGLIHRTPVLESRLIDQAVGSRVRFKCEMFQRGGSHKVRGAFNWILAQQEQRLLTGAVTASSGNHGAALAIASSYVGIPSVVIMPEDSNASKRAATVGYGAEVVSQGVNGSNRETVADEIALERGYRRNTADAVDGIAGLGTLGFEIAGTERLEVVCVPVGLGALISGVAIGLKSRAPNIRLIGVEPRLGDDMRRSIAADKIVRLERVPETIADGARALAPSERTFSIVRRFVDDVVVVSDGDILEAMRLIWTRLKVVAEPTAALAFAAIVSGAVSGDALCLLSGGNVDWEAMKPLEREEGDSRL